MCIANRRKKRHSERCAMRQKQINYDDWKASSYPACSGAPNDRFLWNIIRRSKYCLGFSITWGRLKISRWPFQSRNFYASSIKRKSQAIFASPNKRYFSHRKQSWVPLNRALTGKPLVFWTGGRFSIGGRTIFRAYLIDSPRFSVV